MASNDSKSSSSLTLNEKVIASFRPTKKFSYHKGASITSLDFNDSGQYLISAGVDKSIQLYDTHKGIHQDDIQSQKYGAHLARFTHEGLNCLYASTPTVTAKSENAIRYLSLANNQYIRYFRGHEEQVHCLEVDPIRDIFLSSSFDRTVKLWDLKVSSPIGEVQCGQPTVVAFDPKGMVFSVGKYPDPQDLSSRPAELSLYDIRTFDKGPFMTLHFDCLSGQEWNKIEFSNNGKLILVSTDSSEHYLLDAFLGQLLATLDLARTRASEHYSGDWMTFKYPYSGSTSFTPCGKYIIAGTPHSSVMLFDLNGIKSSESAHYSDFDNKSPFRLQPFQELSTNQGIPKIIAFNPKLLTFATADSAVTLWQPSIKNV